mmetsp:Transcript_29171/g.69246  ORF Transcript_29171/g.69246 Transcript_29171/m.69246 type:complete len:434 (+) Transcript_29171:577-1878(+)
MHLGAAHLRQVLRARAAAVAEQVRDEGAVLARWLLAAEHDGEAGLQLLGLGAEKRDRERPLEQQVVDAGVGTERLHPGKRLLRHHRDDHARVGQGHGKVGLEVSAVFEAVLVPEDEQRLAMHQLVAQREEEALDKGVIQSLRPPVGEEDVVEGEEAGEEVRREEACKELTDAQPGELVRSQPHRLLPLRLPPQPLLPIQQHQPPCPAVIPPPPPVFGHANVAAQVLDALGEHGARLVQHRPRHQLRALHQDLQSHAALVARVGEAEQVLAVEHFGTVGREVHGLHRPVRGLLHGADGLAEQPREQPRGIEAFVCDLAQAHHARALPRVHPVLGCAREKARELRLHAVRGGSSLGQQRRHKVLHGAVRGGRGCTRDERHKQAELDHQHLELLVVGAAGPEALEETLVDDASACILLVEHRLLLPRSAVLLDDVQ